MNPLPPATLQGIFPQILSGARALSSVLFIIPASPFILIASWVFFAISDVLDGYSARYFKTSSYLGMVLDPFADKLWMYLFLIYLYTQDPSTSALFAPPFLGRDLVVMLKGGAQSAQGKSLAPQKIFWAGKAFTTLQWIVVGLFLFTGGVYPLITIPLFIIGSIACYIDLFS